MATETIVPDLGVEADAGASESAESSTGHEESSGQQRQSDARQADKDYQAWLKGLREDGDSGKFARRAKDDFARLQELKRLDPKGIEGVRELKTLVDGIAHGDKKGVEALSAIQESLAESQAVLDALTSGDPGAFDNLTDDHRDGLIRMTPRILDHLAENNADAYTAALLPHFVGALRESELASAFNSMVGVLNERPPSYLTEDQKGAWMEDRLNRVVQTATLMSRWFQAQEDRLKGLDGEARKGAEGKSETQATQTAESKRYWEQSIYPETNAHAETSFIQTLKPWEERLAKSGIRLSEDKKKALAREFVSEVVSKATGSADYQRQMRHYNAQRRPDKSAVVSTFRAEFNRHAAKAMESLIRRDYGQILERPANGKKAPIASATGTKAAPVDKGVKIVSVKPRRENIDFPRTPPDWIYQNKWRLRDGSVVQYRP